MTRTNREEDGEDLIRFIEDGANRIGKSVDIPAPEGRVQAGWVAVQSLKIQPEAHTMLEQIREHKLFKGKWKTSTQVAWSMIYLGLRAMYQFYEKDDTFAGFRSNFLALTHANAEAENERKQETLKKAARMFRSTVHKYLDKQTAFGRYRAWVTLDHAVKAREMVEDVRAYDLLMRNPSAPATEGSLIFDNRAGEMWERLFPVTAGDIDEHAADDLYVEMTQPYFDELEATRAAQRPTED